MNKKIISVIGWIVAFQFISFLIGQFTQADITSWYVSLPKSTLTPPALVFPIVWTILYTMIAIAGWILWQHRYETIAQSIMGFYIVQMLFNWSWSPIFFHWHYITLSFYWIVGTLLFTLITIRLAWRDYRPVSYLLMPYSLWLMFATYLNGFIVVSSGAMPFVMH